MNNTKEYDRGAVIFREGDPGDCMYELDSGSIGIYRNYGTPDEKLITTLFSNRSLQLFGEMGLLEHLDRSATAVVMEDNTTVTRISEEEFGELFEKNPVVVLELLKQMCNRLRKTTKAYVDACHTAYDTVEDQKKGTKKERLLLDPIARLCEFYAAYHPFF